MSGVTVIPTTDIGVLILDNRLRPDSRSCSLMSLRVVCVRLSSMEQGMERDLEQGGDEQQGVLARLDWYVSYLCVGAERKSSWHLSVCVSDSGVALMHILIPLQSK